MIRARRGAIDPHLTLSEKDYDSQTYTSVETKRIKLVIIVKIKSFNKFFSKKRTLNKLSILLSFSQKILQKEPLQTRRLQDQKFKLSQTLFLKNGHLS